LDQDHLAMRALLAAAALAAFFPAAVRATSDTSLRCAGGIVSLGDATIDLLGKCGAPALREPLVDEAYVASRVGYLPLRRTLFVTAERWTYDFGPQRFLMFVTVERGKVAAVERGGYGYAREEPPSVPVPRAECDSSAIRAGSSKLDLLARCGEPVLVDVRPLVDLYPADVSRGVVGWRPGQIRDLEVWTYDFGPQQLVRFVFFENGVVREVETGGHGYAR
jgi:hypothetical protein